MSTRLCFLSLGMERASSSGRVNLTWLREVLENVRSRARDLSERMAFCGEEDFENGGIAPEGFEKVDVTRSRRQEPRMMCMMGAVLVLQSCLMTVKDGDS